MFARIVRGRVQAGKAEEALEFFQSGVLSSMKTREGFLEALVLLNRETSESMGITCWQDAQSLGASEDSAISMRAAVRNRRRPEADHRYRAF
jgi:heme-degrading monooxygenase HmoA